MPEPGVQCKACSAKNATCTPAAKMVMLCGPCLRKFLASAGVDAVLQLLPKNIKERARAPQGNQQDPLFLQDVGKKTDWWSKKTFKNALVLAHRRVWRGLV